MRVPNGLRIDSPSWPLLQAHISYWGITSLAGNALGTTLVCADLVNEPSYQGLSVKVLDGGAAGQVRQIVTDIAGTITVVAAFTNAAGAVQQIAAGTRFVILSAIGGAGAPAPVLAPSIGLWMFGECDPGMGASLNTLVLTNLAHFPDDIFNNEFWVQVIHNADVPGAAPEREIRRVTDYVGATGTFTCDDFSANVEANDLVCVFHESIMGIEILGYGTLTLSSATVPEDNLRLEVDNYFNGCLFMATEGACRFQPRRIVDWAVGGAGPGSGIFTLDPNNPLTGLPGVVDYVIIGDQTEFIPAADGGNNRIPSDVIGSKASTAVYAKDNVSDIIRYLKGLMDSQITASGVADAGSGVGLIRDAARTEIDDWWNGQTVLMLTGAAAFQKRPITDFLAASDDIIVAPNFDGAVAAGDIYVILAHYNMIVPRAVDDVANALTSQVIGRKDDTALYAAAVNATLMRYVKGLITAGIAVPGAVSDVGPAITDFDTTLAEATDDHYNGMLLMIIDGPNAGQAHTIDDYAGGTKNVSFRVGDQWTDVPVDGNSFVILPSAALYTVAGITGATGIFHEQADAGFTEEIVAAETFIVTLTVADTRYILRDLRVKCEDPTAANTVTITLYTLINGVETAVDTFVITNANFGTYHSLMDMFGVPYVAGDSIRVSATGSAAGPYTLDGQYSHGKTNV